jgi:medium-chain acyl-[acyl-carrier-protein] hydrolase
MRLMEPPATRAAALAEGLFAEMSPYLDRPYVLAGHSVGAVIAFELARLARARGRPAPAALIVSGARSPGTPRRESDLHPLPEAEFVTALDERYGGIPPAVRSQPELLALLLPLMRADVSVYETYALRPEAPLDCPILALGGRTDVHVTEDDVLAWRTHTRGRFEAQFFPGGHFFIQSDFGPAADCVKHFLSRLSEGLFF